jgi:hypothetical protein
MAQYCSSCLAFRKYLKIAIPWDVMLCNVVDWMIIQSTSLHDIPEDGKLHVNTTRISELT